MSTHGGQERSVFWVERVEKVWGIFLSFTAHSSEPRWPLTPPWRQANNPNLVDWAEQQRWMLSVWHSLTSYLRSGGKMMIDAFQHIIRWHTFEMRTQLQFTVFFSNHLILTCLTWHVLMLLSAYNASYWLCTQNIQLRRFWTHKMCKRCVFKHHLTYVFVEKRSFLLQVGFAFRFFVH